MGFGQRWYRRWVKRKWVNENAKDGEKEILDVLCVLKFDGWAILKEDIHYHYYGNYRKKNMKKTRHEGDEGTVKFWLYMKALYKDEWRK